MVIGALATLTERNGTCRKDVPPAYSKRVDAPCSHFDLQGFIFSFQSASGMQFFGKDCYRELTEFNQRV
jgi:hypothetical protein